MRQHNEPDAEAQTDCVDPRFATAPLLFFALGAQKSGTSWLEYYLRGHPEVCVPEWKELNYWARLDGIVDDDPLLRLESRKRARRSIKYRIKLKMGWATDRQQRRDRGYRSAVATTKAPGAPHTAYADAIFACRTGRSRAFGEVCPQYALLGADTLRDMAALGPRVRFLFLMRDPVARLISGVRHNIRFAADEDAITQDALIEGVHKSLDDPGGWVMQMTAYHETIARLEASVPVADIGCYFYEDLFDQGQINTLCDFLGVSHWTADTQTKIHAGGRPEIDVPQMLRQQIAQALQPVYDAMQARFGDTLPEAWQKSAAMIEAPEAVHG